MSLIRLDPLSGIYQLRAYSEPCNKALPLAEEMREYVLVGVIVIAGSTASVTGVHGDIRTDAFREFKEQLRGLGVTTLEWERHREGRGLIVKSLTV